ncbi:DUF1427 family protein [Clostridium aestuarii]|uniref:DUF1427 family protein n=1 Tax=Clostridium aestuarii TaxID=338193 RepID=A0ABT4D2A0_9CLOT|nr:DUF1427 family protein [Clostridium aestuarii]MCY6484762.1 DUF1427 family protein [Clostridium aestuarii]
MKLTFIALLTGIITGLIFSIIKLPLPAPPTLPGIAGIIGIFFGSKIFEYIKTFK